MKNNRGGCLGCLSGRYGTAGVTNLPQVSVLGHFSIEQTSLTNCKETLESRRTLLYS